MVLFAPQEKRGLFCGVDTLQSSTNSSARGLCGSPYCFCVPGEAVLLVCSDCFPRKIFLSLKSYPEQYLCFFAKFYIISLALLTRDMKMDFTVLCSSFCFSLVPYCGLRCYTQLYSGHILMRLETGTASSCERKRFTCKEAFPCADTGIVWAKVLS